MNGRAIVAIIQEISALIDTGKYDDISIDEIRAHIKQGDILRKLVEMGADLSVHLQTQTYGNFEVWYIDKLQSILNAYGGDERRKWGIENRGLCLLLSWTATLLMSSDDIEWPR